MAIVRNILGVIVGYLIFALSALLFFNISGIDPHAAADLGIIGIVLVFGSVLSFVGGGATKQIAATNTLAANCALAILIAGFAAFSFFKSPGNHYTQLAAIFLFAPLSILGGFLGGRSQIQR